MAELLFLLLLLSPLRFSLPLELPVVKVCTALELASSHDTLGLCTARNRWLELRYAPALARSQYLPEHEVCSGMESFWDSRVKYIERQRLLYGMYRWCDCDEALEQAKAERRYWGMCATATSEFEGVADRRRALLWLEQ